MSLIEDLKWRHACKGMNGAKVPQDVVERILEAINLTPTSLGMQAFKVFVIENKELKEKLDFVKEKGIGIFEGPFQPNPDTRFFYVLDPNGLKIQFVEMR